MTVTAAVRSLASAAVRRTEAAASRSFTNPTVRYSSGAGIPTPFNALHRARGLYLTAGVRKGHELQIVKVKTEAARKVITVTVADPAKAGAQGGRAEKFVSDPFGFSSERWTVVVKDSAGKPLKTTKITGGGPVPLATGGRPLGRPA